MRTNAKSNPRLLLFVCRSARMDGLVKREATPLEMVETFQNRDDFLYYRQIQFGKRVKIFGPQEGNTRPIVVRHVLIL